MRANGFWPGRPRLLHDESFSSWFARTAAANGLRPAELHHILQPGGDRNPRDLDRYADVHLVHRLADCTGREADALAQSTFHRWAGMVFERDDEVKAAARIAAHRAGEGVGPWLDALLRRQLGISAPKTPCPRPSPDTFAADGISGCAE